MRHIRKQGFAALVMSMAVVASSLIFIFDSSGEDLANDHNATVYSKAFPFSQQSSLFVQNSGNAVNLALNSGAPAKYIYLPNAYAQNLGQNDVSPLYTKSPAPMGITDYGFMEPSGLKIAYSYETSSFLGTVMFEDLSAQYLMNGNPGTVAAQLSAVLSVDNGQGNNADYLWVKNIMLYTPSTGESQFVSNIWEISSPSFALQNGMIQSGSGSVIPGAMYYYAGPVIQMDTENTVGLYMNSVNINGHDAVVFQYSSGQGEHGEVSPGITYDTVVLSTSTYNETGTNAKFIVDGFSKTPSGLLKDVELAITGPGMGSTTSIYNANGQLTLKFMAPDGTYTRLPAAYNYGSNTGETVQGLSVWWTSQMKPMGHLSTGPSLPVSLWGSQVSHSGAVNLQGKIDPGNAFVFISMGKKFDNNTAAWAPVNENGTYKFSLPGRISYTMAIMASNFEPQYATIATAANESSDEGTGEPHGGGQGGEGSDETLAWNNFTLSFNGTMGVYTPLYANGDVQLKQLSIEALGNGSSVGNGTLADPYILENNQYKGIDRLFASANNFLYPQFSGIFLQNTHSEVRIDSPPSFQYKYPVDHYNLLHSMGLPYYNNMNLLFYNTSGVTITNATSITGWFSNTMLPGTIANVMFLESENFLVAANTFNSMGSSLAVYSQDSGSDNGTIWGNTFEKDALLGSQYSNGLLHGTEPFAVSLFSSGNLVYNNFFGLGIGVSSPLYDPYSMQQMLHSNSWNLPEKVNLTYTNSVNGMSLNGSIVDCGYQGGNYWEGQNVEQLPYNANGKISFGGDYIPLQPPAFEINFNALGEIPNDGWGIHLGMKYQNHYTGNSGSVSLINGSYVYRIVTSSIYTSSPTTGTVNVSGFSQTVNVTFTKVTYPVTFSRSGISEGTEWSLSVGGIDVKTTNNSVALNLQNGSYSYSATLNVQHQFDLASGNILVLGKPVNQEIGFSNRLHSVNFVLDHGEFQGQWSVSINGTSFSSSSASILSDLQAGVYQYEVTAPDGYVVTPSTGILAVYDGNLIIPLEIQTKTYKVTFVSQGIDSGTQWQVELGLKMANSTHSEIAFEVPAGNYTYNVLNITQYATDQPNGYVIVSDKNLTVDVVFRGPTSHSGEVAYILIGAAIFGTFTTIAVYMTGRKK